MTGRRGGRGPVRSLSALATEDPEGLFAQQLSGPSSLLLKQLLASLHFLLERDMRYSSDFVYATELHASFNLMSSFSLSIFPLYI